jgi:hypothetical protein
MLLQDCGFLNVTTLMMEVSYIHVPAVSQVPENRNHYSHCREHLEIMGVFSKRDIYYLFTYVTEFCI